MKRHGLAFFITSALLFGQNPGRPGGTTAVVQSQAAVSLADIEKMLTAQVPEDVIALKVKQTGRAFNLSAEEIIRLKKAGASKGLLKLLMDPSVGYASRESTPDPVIPDGTEVKLLLKNPLSSATAQPEHESSLRPAKPSRCME